MHETDFMEMPTPCRCGTWFDLNDGFPSRNGKFTICEACYDKEVEIEDLEEMIQDYEDMIGDGQNVRENKRELKLLKLKLEKLKNE